MTTIAANDTQSWVDTHRTLALSETDFDWLNELREAAILKFSQIGLPDRRAEDWRYTDLASIKQHNFELATQSQATEVELPRTSFKRLVFIDGHLNTDLSDANIAHVESLCDTWSDQDVHEHFNGALPEDSHSFARLNTAYAQDGVVIRVPANVEAQTLELLFVWQSEGSVGHVRNLLIAKENTKATIIERHIGADNRQYLANCVTEVFAGDNAHIDHYRIQQGGNNGAHVGGLFVHQSRSSQVKNHNICLGGKLNRYDVRGVLAGEGGHLEMNGLVLGQQDQHIDNHTEVVHAVANCTSDEFYKTVLDDESRSVFRGRIIVAEDAQQTSADQQNNNLLLSKDAEADSKPQLEIYADDVKCSHGATVGQLDPKSMFYLRSRGIDEKTARALLTFAFANEVIERIQIQEIRSEITKVLAGELTGDLDLEAFEAD